jgi:hypothetical protein
MYFSITASAVGPLGAFASAPSSCMGTISIAGSPLAITGVPMGRVDPRWQVLQVTTRCFEVFVVDGDHHLHHLACSLLGLLVVLLEGSRHVTEIALNSQRGGDELHGGDELLGGIAFQDLDVLVGLVGGFGRGSGLRASRDDQ